MATHLGRLRIVTRRKEGKCTYLHCPKERKLLPGEQTFILSIKGMAGKVSTIFYKPYHIECFGPWAVWRASKVPVSKDGRKEMTLSPEDKMARLKLTRTRSRLLRELRGVKTGERLNRLVERIQALDLEIQETGYPVSPYKGRRSKNELIYVKFIREIKEHYGSWRAAPKAKLRHELIAGDNAIPGGEAIWGDRFDKDMDEWHIKDEKRLDKERERQGQDWESTHTDVEEE